VINYRSLADLSQDILEGIHLVPPDIDLVVGIPRSGMLAATQIALLRNLHLCSIQEYLLNLPFENGRTRPVLQGNIKRPRDATKVLVVDDSIASGKSLKIIRDKLAASESSAEHIFVAIYATPEALGQVDISFLTLSMPRFFQWNLMHRNDLHSVYFDMDGIFCVDPTPEENDDGPRYASFLANARPLILPSQPIGGIITSRLEKYRPQTEAWLEQHGVRYGKLFMLNLPDARTRREQGAHATFKAEVFSSLEHATLYVESESTQAKTIHSLAGKPVVDFYGRRNPGVSAGITWKDRLKARTPIALWKTFSRLRNFSSSHHCI